MINRLGWMARSVGAAFAATLVVMPGLARAEDDSSGQPRLTPLLIGYSTGIESDFLEEERELLVSLPASYQVSERRYPVVFVLDGLSNFQHVTSSVGMLTMTGQMPEVIVVGVVNSDRARDFTMVARPNRRNGGADRFLAFLGEELAPYMEMGFRASEHRTLVGHSLGGALAVNAMIERPELFDAFLLASPAITADQRDLPDGTVALTKRLDETLSGSSDLEIFLYMTMSDDENPAWRRDLTALEKVLKRHRKIGVSWESHELPGEIHGTSPVKTVYDGLRALFEEYRGAEVLGTGDAGKIAAHYGALSRRFDVEIVPPEGPINRMGYAYLQNSDFRKATALFELNVRSHPDSANVYDSLGEALERQGKIEEALQRYERAVELGEDFGGRALAVYRANRDRAAEMCER